MLARRLQAGLPALLLGLLFTLPHPQPVSAQRRILCVHGIEAPATLELRSGPAADSPIIDQLTAKTCGLTLAGRCIGMRCPMTVGGRSGWVDTNFVGVFETQPIETGTPKAAAASPAAPKPPAAPAPSETQSADPVPATAGLQTPPRDLSPPAGRGACVVDVARNDTLRIRSGPGVVHGTVGEIPPGACGIAQVGGCSGNWCRVTWHGQQGWVNRRYLD